MYGLSVSSFEVVVAVDSRLHPAHRAPPSVVARRSRAARKPGFGFAAGSALHTSAIAWSIGIAAVPVGVQRGDRGGAGVGRDAVQQHGPALGAQGRHGVGGVGQDEVEVGVVRPGRARRAARPPRGRRGPRRPGSARCRSGTCSPPHPRPPVGHRARPRPRATPRRRAGAGPGRRCRTSRGRASWARPATSRPRPGTALDRQGREVGQLPGAGGRPGAVERPSVDRAPPLRGHGGGSPPGAEESAGDRGDGVGVVAAAHGGLERELQVLRRVAAGGGVVGRDRGAGDGRPRALQGLDHPAVLREVPTAGWPRPRRAARPTPSARSGGRWSRASRTPSKVPCRTAWRMPRHQIAQASPASGSKWVRALIRCGRLDQRLGVIEVGQGDRCGAHQRAVAGGPPGPVVHLPRRLGGRGSRGFGESAAGPRRSARRRPWPRGPPTHAAAMPSSTASSRRSAPVAAARAIGIAIEVSSVHSPGAHPNGPPPIMATSVSSGSGGPNS